MSACSICTWFKFLSEWLLTFFMCFWKQVMMFIVSHGEIFYGILHNRSSSLSYPAMKELALTTAIVSRANCQGNVCMHSCVHMYSCLCKRNFKCMWESMFFSILSVHVDFNPPLPVQPIGQICIVFCLWTQWIWLLNSWTQLQHRWSFKATVLGFIGRWWCFSLASLSQKSFLSSCKTFQHRGLRMAKISHQTSLLCISR